MQTTLTVDDDLLARAKEQAEALGMTVSDVVNQALRLGLATPQAPAEDLRTPLFGDESEHGPMDLKALAEAMNDEYLLGKLRG